MTIHHFIIDEGASTCIMSKSVWYKLGSPELKPFDITLRAYDRHPSAPVGLYLGMPVQLADKNMLIDIEVLDTQLDYNILLGLSHMHKMLAVASSVFQVMMSSHDRRIITIDQLTYYEKKAISALDGVLPFISSSHEWITTYAEHNQCQFKPPTLLGTFPRNPPVIKDISPTTRELVCMMSSSNIPPIQEPIPDTTRSVTANSMYLPYTITQTPFLYPPPGFVFHQVMETLTLQIWIIWILQYQFGIWSQ